MKYTADHLPDVRLFAATCARHAGLDEETVGDFVIAVNEIATNAVRYGSPLARVRLWTSDGGLFAEVHDSGRWEPDSTPGRSPPGPWAEGGMGLWVTRQICSTLDIESGPAGTIVRLRFPLR